MSDTSLVFSRIPSFELSTPYTAHKEDRIPEQQLNHL